MRPSLPRSSNVLKPGPDSLTVLRALTDMTQVRSSEMMRQRFAENLTQIFPIAGIRFLTPGQNGRLDEPLSCSIQSSQNRALTWNRTPRRGILPQGALARCVNERRHVYPSDSSDLDYFAIAKHAQLLEIIEVRQLAQAEVERPTLAHIFEIYNNFLSILREQEIDSLTGVMNRGAFDAQMNLTAQSMRQQARPSSAEPQWWLLMIDADHFKSVNDRFGHLIGDEVLLLLARVMNQAFRSVDRIYRYGGEEFAILLSPCDRPNALRLAERFRRMVAAQHFPQVEHVTISGGLAPIDRYDHIANIIGRADQALYQAKRNGRNAICEYVDRTHTDIPPGLQMTGALELFS